MPPASSSASASDKIQRIPFSGINFSLWRIKFSSYADSQGWLSFLETDAASLTNEKVKKLKATLLLSLSDQVLMLFSNLRDSTPFKIFEAMKTQYEKADLASKHLLRDKLSAEKQSDGEDMSLYIGRIQSTIQRLKDIGDVISDTEILHFVFRGVEPRYKSFVDGLRRDKDLTVASAISLLTDHQQTLKHSTRSVPQQPQINLTKSFHHKKPFRKNIKHQHGRFEKKVCNYCHRSGHTIDTCYKLINQNKFKESKANSEAKDVKPKENFSFMLTSASSRQSGWYLDSGATHHTCNDESLLTDAKDVHGDSVMTASGQEVQVAKIGDVHLLINGKSIILKQVKYAKEFHANLVSVSRLCAKGGQVTFNKDAAHIYFGTYLFLKAKKVANLYQIECQQSIALAATNVDHHARLGHMSKTLMKQLINIEMLPDVPIVDVASCEACLLAKSTRDVFKPYSSRKKSYQSFGKTLGRFMWSHQCFK